MITIYTDAGSRKNPGKSACAFIVVKNNKIIHEESKYLGIKTNNEAEYNAIILALETIKEKDIEIISDSEVVVRQIKGEYKVNHKHLKKLNEKVIRLCEGRNVSFKNAKREDKFISHADMLVNKELDKN